MTEIAKKAVTEKESVFRGTWQPTIHRQVHGVYRFLPTPLPIEPKKKNEENEEVPKEPLEEGSPRKKPKDAEKELMKG